MVAQRAGVVLRVLGEPDHGGGLHGGRRFFRAGQAPVVVERVLANLINNNKNVDLAPDGKRIVAVMPAEGPDMQRSQSHVVFLENFFDELRRRAPASVRGSAS